MTNDSPGITSYWLPMVVFGVFTTLEAYTPSAWYPWIYLTKICAVIVSLIAFPSSLREIVPDTRVVLPAVIVGLVIFAQWVILDRWIPYPHMGTRTAFNPFAELSSPVALWTLLVSRFIGLVVIVPIIEETFWRNFGLRYATSQDITSVPIGKFSTSAFWIVAIGSAITHPEWLVALIAGILFALLLRSTRSMFAVIVSHAVANFALGIYIVSTGDWKYW